MIDTADRLARYVTGMYGPPAFVLRQKAVDGAWDDLLAKCRRVRTDMLSVVAAYARACSREFDTAVPEDPEVAVRGLRKTVGELAKPLTPMQAASWNNIADAVASFNRKWRDYVQRIDLREVNKAREDYNQWYLIEKEAALKNERVARMGYQPLDPLSVADIAAALPTLPMLAKHAIPEDESTRSIYVVSILQVPLALILFGIEMAGGGGSGWSLMLIPLALFAIALAAIYDSMNRRIARLEGEVEQLREERDITVGPLRP